MTTQLEHLHEHRLRVRKAKEGIAAHHHKLLQQLEVERNAQAVKNAKPLDFTPPKQPGV